MFSHRPEVVYILDLFFLNRSWFQILIIKKTSGVNDLARFRLGQQNLKLVYVETSSGLKLIHIIIDLG